MSGRIFEMDQETNSFRLAISYGGLLMQVKGDTERLRHTMLDEPVYVLMNKL